MWIIQRGDTYYTGKKSPRDWSPELRHAKVESNLAEVQSLTDALPFAVRIVPLPPYP